MCSPFSMKVSPSSILTVVWGYCVGEYAQCSAFRIPTWLGVDVGVLLWKKWSTHTSETSPMRKSFMLGNDRRSRRWWKPHSLCYSGSFIGWCNLFEFVSPRYSDVGLNSLRFSRSELCVVTSCLLSRNGTSICDSHSSKWLRIKWEVYPRGMH